MKRIIITAALLAPPTIATAQDLGLYHTKSSDTLGCSDRKITAQINHAVKHPGISSDAHFESLWNEGHCAPLSPSVQFKVIRFESFVVPAGKQEVAYAELSVSGAQADHFYVMRADISPVRTITNQRKHRRGPD